MKKIISILILILLPVLAVYIYFRLPLYYSDTTRGLSLQYSRGLTMSVDSPGMSGGELMGKTAEELADPKFQRTMEIGAGLQNNVMIFESPDFRGSEAGYRITLRGPIILKSSDFLNEMFQSKGGEKPINNNILMYTQDERGVLINKNKTKLIDFEIESYSNETFELAKKQLEFILSSFRFTE